MTQQVAAESLEGIVAIALLAFFFVGPLRWFAIDWARERMFAARDRFFDEAAHGRVSFTDPCYLAVRRRINENIRFAHSGSLMQVLAHAWAGTANMVATPNRELRETADRLADAQARATAHRTLDRVEMTSVALLVLKSPITSIILITFLVPRILAWRAKSRPNADRWDWVRPFAIQVQAEVPALARVRKG